MFFPDICGNGEVKGRHVGDDIVKCARETYGEGHKIPSVTSKFLCQVLGYALTL